MGDKRERRVSAGLRTLPYQREVAAILEKEHPKAFAALRRTATTPEHAELRRTLLRQAYRLDPAGHPVPHGAAARAAAALGIGDPIDVFAFEGALGNNVELIFMPGRPTIAVSGETLELLDAKELCAVAGHELAHYVLWTADDGRHLAASRLLDAAESDARTPAEYLETARRLRLASEFYADRGALVACGDLAVTLRSLLKLASGPARVDSEGYLRQAAEVDFSTPSAGASYPETVVRAWALQRWQQDGDAAEPEIGRCLASRLDLNTLDVVDQDRLRALTISLVATVLGDDAMRTDGVIDHARHFGASADGSAEPFALEALAPETRRYLAAVLMDFATVDPALGAEGVARMIELSRRVGLEDEVDRLVTAELDLSGRARARVLARARELADA